MKFTMIILTVTHSLFTVPATQEQHDQKNDTKTSSQILQPPLLLTLPPLRSITRHTFLPLKILGTDSLLPIHTPIPLRATCPPLISLPKLTASRDRPQSHVLVHAELALQIRLVPFPLGLGPDVIAVAVSCKVALVVSARHFDRRVPVARAWGGGVGDARRQPGDVTTLVGAVRTSFVSARKVSGESAGRMNGFTVQVTRRLLLPTFGERYCERALWR